LQNGQYTKKYLTEETYKLAKQFLTSASLKLRTLDALHLALSQQLGAELFTADIELANAAAHVKLPYRCPIAHKNS
jgi:predicted nucleic acid-binding protein